MGDGTFLKRFVQEEVASGGRGVKMGCRGAIEEIKLTVLGVGFLRGMRLGRGTAAWAGGW